jgi:hypothetical protein
MYLAYKSILLIEVTTFALNRIGCHLNSPILKKPIVAMERSVACGITLAASGLARDRSSSPQEGAGPFPGKAELSLTILKDLPTPAHAASKTRNARNTKITSSFFLFSIPLSRRFV